MRKLVVATVVVFLIGMMAVCSTLPAKEAPPPPPPAPPIPGGDWTVVYTFKQAAPGDPQVRIYLMVKASTEGEAAIKGYKCLSDKLIGGALEALQFLEAQRKN